MKEKNLIFSGSYTESLARFDPELSALRMLQISFDWADPQLLDHLPKSGIIVNGLLYAVDQTLDSPTSESVGFVLPTPQASDNRDRGNINTPSIQRRIQIGKQVGLSALFKAMPCPMCVEPIMGFPEGWLDK